MWVFIFLLLASIGAVFAYYNQLKIAIPFIILSLIVLIVNKTLLYIAKIVYKEFLDRNRSKLKRILRHVKADKVANYIFKNPINPKPYTLQEIDFDQMYMVTGAYATPLNFTVTYTHSPLRYPDQLRDDFAYLISRAREKAREAGATFFNGPNTRLIQVTNEVIQGSDGRELRHANLTLGPVSWFEYSAFHNFPDHKLKSGETIEEAYASVEHLYENGGDFRWCRLGNIITLALLPITSDGYGIIQRRSTSVSADPGKYTSGIAECMHRYLDEATAEDLYDRRVSLKELYDSIDPQRSLSESLITHGVNEDYCPTGVPSPYLTARRGLFEEVSEELHDIIPAQSYVFLNIAVSITGLIPNLVGVINLGMPKDEVNRIIKNSPGRDHHERTLFEYVVLDPRYSATNELLLPRNWQRWTPGGLAALVSAVHWQRQMTKASEVTQI